MRIYKLCLGVTLGITSCLLVTAVLCAEQSALKTEPGALKIKGGLRSGGEYFTEFSLVATADISNLKIVKGGLINKDRTVRLKASQVTLEPTDVTSLAAGGRALMTISVSGVQKTGVYSGKLRFSYTSGGAKKKRQVSITLEVTQPTLEIVKGDKGLKLVGPVGASTRFEDGFRLVARDGDLATIKFFPSDLVDGHKRIDFSKITVEPAKQALAENEGETFKLVVTGVDKPGTYSGQLRVLKPGEASAQGLTIPVQLTAEATPVVAKVPETAKLDAGLVRCGPLCGVAELLVGSASVQRTREIRLENTSPVSASLGLPEIIDVKGQTGGYQLSARDFKFDMKGVGDWKETPKLSSKSSDLLNVTVKANDIPPDEYKGTIRIPVEDQGAPVSIDVDLKVRGGLGWPIMVIALGWFAGRGIKLLEAAEARRLRLWTNRLKEKIEKIQNDDERNKCLNKIPNIRQDIEAARFEEARRDLEKLGRDVDKELRRQAKRRLVADADLDDADQKDLDRRRARNQQGQKILGWASGAAPEVEASFTLGIFRTLGYLALFVWITYLGLQQKYIGQATFGANALVDYMGLLTWAMSADIVGRTIASIGQEK